MTQKIQLLKPFSQAWKTVPHVLSGLTFVVSSLWVVPSSAWAQSTYAVQTPEQLPFSQSNSNDDNDRLDFSDVGRPTRRTGGGSRGPCSVPDKPPLTALVPETSTGRILSESPEFLFYVPFSLTSGQVIEFVLKDEQSNKVHTANISAIATQPGITQLTLPPDIKLEANQNYEWYFLVHCSTRNQEQFVYVNGMIQRVEQPVLERQLALVPVEDQINLYTDKGIWYDAVSQLGNRLRVAPQDEQALEDWTSLLQSVGLEHLAQEPFVTCCSLED